MNAANGKEWNWCSGFVLLILLALLWAGTAAADNLAAIRDFGISRSEPIDKSFFFHEGKYIEAPYVVERRGLDIYINDVLIVSGPEYPIYEYKVEQDPGDPPPSSSPFDSYPAGTDLRDVYWSKKWRYLYSHFDHETAKNMMLETYRKSSEIEDVSWSDMEDIVRLVHKDGRNRLVSLSLSGGGFALNPPRKEELLKRVQEEAAFHERRLGRDQLVFKKGGFTRVVRGRRAVKGLEVLLSDASDTDKLKALEEARLIRSGPKGELERWIVTDFQGSPQLAERFLKFKDGYRARPVIEDANKWLANMESMPAELAMQTPAEIALEGKSSVPDLTAPAEKEPNLLPPAVRPVGSQTGPTGWLVLGVCGIGAGGLGLLLGHLGKRRRSRQAAQ
ncbi:MAG TPA: hypothetical protein VMX13_07335 [Sedimentisphaerales bacterium]|nr:hypothetical protein [Sedimentisphaerales bacterium]